MILSDFSWGALIFGVSELRASMGELDMDFPKLRWGYHEIELLDNTKWHFSMLFDWENELEITADSATLDCDRG